MRDSFEIGCAQVLIISEQEVFMRDEPLTSFDGNPIYSDETLITAAETLTRGKYNLVCRDEKLSSHDESLSASA
jgi:hypothetical protein